MEVAEFRALQLGTWLSTPDGRLLVEAVELVTPPFYRADVELLVEALQIAAKEQQNQVRKDLALGVGVLVLVSIALGTTTK